MVQWAVGCGGWAGDAMTTVEPGRRLGHVNTNSGSGWSGGRQPGQPLAVGGVVDATAWPGGTGSV